MGKIRRRMLIICVSVICVATAALTVWAADSQGWFTAKVELTNIEHSLIRSFSISADDGDSFHGAELGSGALALTSKEYLSLSKSEQFTILSAASQYEFADAEEEFFELAAEVEIAQSDYSDDIDQEYAAVRLEYEFLYSGTDEDTLDAYVRFISPGSYANSIDTGSSEEFCLQDLSYISENGDTGKLTRLFFTDGSNAYYYPEKLSEGEWITLIYTLFVSKDILEDLDFDTLLEFELVQVSSNVSILEWNVDFSGDTPEPFDTLTAEPAEYYPYEISVPEEEEELEEELEEGGESGGNKEPGEGDETEESDEDNESGKGGKSNEDDDPDETSSDDGNDSEDKDTGTGSGDIGDTGDTDDDSNGGGDDDPSDDSDSGSEDDSPGTGSPSTEEN